MYFGNRGYPTAAPTEHVNLAPMQVKRCFRKTRQIEKPTVGSLVHTEAKGRCVVPRVSCGGHPVRPCVLW